jgi:hypothetical protein
LKEKIHLKFFPDLISPKIEGKNTSKILSFFFLIKIAIFLSLGLHKEGPCYRRSLQPSKRTSSTSKRKFINFFLFLWVIIALLDPDPDRESGSGSRDPLLNPDPILSGSGVQKNI